MDSKRILILGITASGKGRVAFELAKALNAEIISIDSMKVYRRMDIGTAKPGRDAQRQIKYHLIDIVEPSEQFSVGRFLEMAEEAVSDITRNNKPIVAVGGTALYIKALLYGLFEGPGSDEKIRAQLQRRAQEQGLAQLHQELEKFDPVAAGNIHPNDAKRIIRALEVYKITGKPISSLQRQFDSDKPRHDWTVIGLRRERAVESKRINTRVKKMIELGLVDEVASLLAEEKPLSKQARCAIGYAEIIEHLSGKIALDEAVEQIKKNTRRLAKGQRTWFKTFKEVNWLDVGEDESVESIVNRTKRLIWG
jgi:tRNA dimethylallyltransferase